MYDYSRDGITVSAMLDTRRANAQGEYPVKVRVTYRRDRKYYGTGKSLTASDWERLEVTKSRALIDIRESVRDSFDIVRDTVEALIQSGAFTFDALNSRLKRATSDTVNTAFRAKIAALNAADRVGNATIYDTILKGLERFAGDKIAFDSVTVEWVRRYEAFLTKEGKEITTIAIHLRTLRAILNDAIAAGTMKAAAYPFGKGKFEIKEGAGRKMALTLDQIGQIARYDDGSEATRRHRDYWLFLYLCNGINMADFVRLKYSDIVNGEIFFVRQKTERTNRMRREIRAIVTPQMQSIIDSRGNPPAPGAYIFPILKGGENAATVKKLTQYATRAINKRMAAIGEALGIGSISTYTARHSYATVLKRSGANIAYISESLGHNSLQTTENYLASFEREEREKNAALLTNF